MVVNGWTTGKLVSKDGIEEESGYIVRPIISMYKSAIDLNKGYDGELGWSLK